MLNRNGPFRFVLTLLLALAVPFCCCDFRSLLGGCGSCESAGPADSPAVAPSHADSDDGHGARCHCHGRSPQRKDHDRPTREQAPRNDRHGCLCGKTTGKMLSVEKAAFGIPTPVLVAILECPTTRCLEPGALVRIQYAAARGPMRPTTSLLRMHCALIV